MEDPRYHPSKEELILFLLGRGVSIDRSASQEDAWRAYQTYMAENWKIEPATERQKYTIKRAGLSIHRKCTRGEAAAILNGVLGERPMPPDYEHPFEPLTARKSASWHDASYDAYLNSPAWKEKCKLIHQRCGGICERCSQRAMAQVHHLNYDHLYDEPLADLQGLCGVCHLAVTGEQRDRKASRGCLECVMVGAFIIVVAGLALTR